MNEDTYKLLDSGNFRKLERVGPYLIDRPALQAAWRPSQPEKLWKEAVAYYCRSKSGGGRWKYYRKLPESWTIAHGGLVMNIKLTNFGHLGFFPEHTSNWAWIQDRIRSEKRPLRVLNTFAYTGGATLAAAATGADVTHLDAAKGIVSWAKKNACSSGLENKNIRWIIDDVSKYVLREIRRGNKYDAIILDPPSFGRGSKGEVWKFEDMIGSLLENCRKILTSDPVFILLSAHTPGFSPIALQNLIEDITRDFKGKLNCMEMFVAESRAQRKLPSGIMATWQKK